MQGIEFENDKDVGINNSSEVSPSKVPLMVGWLMRIGIADTAMANYVLISIAGIGIGLTIFMYANALAEPKKDLSLDARAILIMNSSR